MRDVPKLSRLTGSLRRIPVSRRFARSGEIDRGEPPTRLIYPTLAQRLTPADVHQLFSPSYEERRWAPTIARTPSSQVELLVQLIRKSANVCLRRPRFQKHLFPRAIPPLLTRAARQCRLGDRSGGLKDSDSATSDILTASAQPGNDIAISA